MGKYTTRSVQKPKPRIEGVHPVMRGIGCIMMVIVPILAYGLSVLLVNYGASHGWPIPPDWLGTPSFHPLLSRLSGVATVLCYSTSHTRNERYSDL